MEGSPRSKSPSEQLRDAEGLPRHSLLLPNHGINTGTNSHSCENTPRTPPPISDAAHGDAISEVSSERFKRERRYSMESLISVEEGLVIGETSDGDFEEELTRRRIDILNAGLLRSNAISALSMTDTDKDDNMPTGIATKSVDNNSTNSADRLRGEDIVLQTKQTCVSNGVETSFERASLFDMAMFNWMNDIIATGSKKILEFEDVYLLPKRFSSRKLFDELMLEWNREVETRGREGADIKRALWRSFGNDLLIGYALNSPYMAVILIQPYFVLHLLQYIVSGHTEFLGIKNAMVLSTLLGVISIISAFSWSMAFHYLSVAGLKIRGSLMAAVFEKSLKLSSGARGKHTTGEIMTLMSADVERLWQATLLVNWLWVGPILCSIAMVLLCLTLGVSGVAAIGTLFLINYIQTTSGNMTGRCRRRLVKFTDERVKVMNEILQGIRVIKYYAWEYPMKEKVTGIRNKEVGHLIHYQGLKLVNSVLAFIGPSLVSFAMFLCFVLLGGTLTIPLVYTSYALLNIIRLPIAIMPMSYAATMEANESLKRITRFLLLEEVQELDRIEFHTNDNSNSNSSKLTENEEATKLPQSKEANDDSSSNEKKLMIEICKADFIWETMEEFNNKLNAHHEEQQQQLQQSTFPTTADPITPTSIAAELSSLKILQDISFTVFDGEFVAIVGSVGSGKSSLLAAMLGQMRRLSGAQAIYGKVALVSQEHWIQNMTLMENVLFGSVMNEEQYADVLDASQLSRDLLSLSHGDYTSIGERGINLSGGQKARVSIARALYQQDIDIYIFDDSLAAVDVHVGKAIFNKAFKELLANKTRIVVLSSNYHLLPQFDKICVMEDGYIKAFGTFSEVATQFPQYANYKLPSKTVETYEQSATDKQQTKDEAEVTEKLEEESEEEIDLSVSLYRTNIELIKHKRIYSRQIMTEEERERGAVTLATFISYFDSAVSAGYGSLVFIAIVILFAAGQTGRVISDMWVGQWAIHGIQTGNTIDAFYFHWYIVLVVGTVAMSIIRGVSFVTVCMNASKYMHENLLLRILRAPINTYFDVTPLGRIINKFSKDLDNMDSLLPDFFVNNLQNGFQCLFILIVCITTTPFILLLMAPTAYLFYRIQSYFRKSSRELKRLDSMSRSPMYSLFNECLNGLTTIRAYVRQTSFIDRFFELADQQTRNFFVFYYSNRWLAIRLDLLSSVVLLSVALLATGIASAGNIVNPNYLGLALVYSLQLTGLLQWTVRIATETETNMTSVERLLQFHSIEPEEKWIDNGKWVESIRSGHYYIPPTAQSAAAAAVAAETEERRGGKRSGSPAHTHRKDHSGGEYELIPIRNDASSANPTEMHPVVWPSKGNILIRNLSLRYRPELPLVLKQLNIVIPGGKRVGICGRTGAGKSSLMLALFRIVQFEAGSEVIVDGRDINTEVSLSELRSMLTIIPQDPVMFSGTLRSNLDPFNKHSEAELWEALERAHLKDDIISKFPKRLDHEVSEQGGNISIGQRQLLCIARALLRRSKIIVMDEATAAVDTITDSKIQSSIRNEFRDCTVLTIAHRLETIADFDLIAVLDSGSVAEYGSPHYLLTCSAADYGPPMTAIADNSAIQQAASLTKDRNLDGKQEGGGGDSFDTFANLGDRGGEEAVLSNIQVNCRGLFKDLVDGLGTERKKAIFEAAANQQFGPSKHS